MNSLAFVTHPSVRIKGSENNYSPSLCLDERCPIKAPHMHCPFCVKTDAYQDPVILKAHYRVKHVDKGIDFAGLKILRCCDHCDIVGIIKGEKRFKGAHWHCYRCRNGFNRRDEAIKHYKTHFRNPQTTFQIQITQDLNLPSGVKPDNHQESLNQQSFPLSMENPLQEIIHPVLPQASLSESNVITADGNLGGDKYKKVKVKEEPLMGRGENTVSVDQGQTIMIIQGDQLESAFADHIMAGGEVSVLDKNNVDPSLSWEIRCRMEEEEKNEYKARMEEYKNQVELLQQRIQELESQNPSSQLRVQDLLASLSLGDQSKQHLAQQISKYLEEVQTQGAAADLRASQDDADDSQQQHHHHHHHHLISSEGIIDQLTNSANGGQVDNQQQLTTADVRVSLAPHHHHHHQDLQSNSVIAQLGHITEPYQVISSCEPTDHQTISISNHHHHHPEGHGHPISDNIISSDSNSSSSRKTNNSINNTIVISNPSAEHARDVQQFFQPVPSSGSHHQHHNNNHEIIVAQAMSPDSGGDQSHMISQKFLVDSGGVLSEGGNSNNPVINLNGDIENNRLLQVVAASSNQGDPASNTFIMETESGQQIIIQRTDSGESEERMAHQKLEPESKRQRIS